jgi:hypothetical protein
VSAPPVPRQRHGPRCAAHDFSANVTRLAAPDLYPPTVRTGVEVAVFVTRKSGSEVLIVSGAQIHPSCCAEVFVDQSAESVASVELGWRVRADGA